MGSPLCILIIDDSPFFLELERQFLRNTPATVIVAPGAEEGLELARKKRPSLIFMDVDMPGLDGASACRRLKSDTELAGIPLILIGDRGNGEHEMAARAAGCDDFLEKPIDRRRFLETGHRFLVSIDRREPRRECSIPVRFACRGSSSTGLCIDLSSGGMFLECPPLAAQGEPLLLTFNLPDAERTPLQMRGRIAWVNSREQIIKPGYPHGYGVEFVDIPEEVGVALRRCFGI